MKSENAILQGAYDQHSTSPQRSGQNAQRLNQDASIYAIIIYIFSSNIRQLYEITNFNEPKHAKKTVCHKREESLPEVGDFAHQDTTEGCEGFENSSEGSAESDEVAAGETRYEAGLVEAVDDAAGVDPVGFSGIEVVGEPFAGEGAEAHAFEEDGCGDGALEREIGVGGEVDIEPDRPVLVVASPCELHEAAPAEACAIAGMEVAEPASPVGIVALDVVHFSEIRLRTALPDGLHGAVHLVVHGGQGVGQPPRFFLRKAALPVIEQQVQSVNLTLPEFSVEQGAPCVIEKVAAVEFHDCKSP